MATRTCPAWVETATAQIKLTGDDAEGNPAADGSLTSFLRATINDEVALDKLNALLKGIKINLKDLLVKEKGNIAIDIALGAIKDLGAIFGLLGETPGNISFPISRRLPSWRTARCIPSRTTRISLATV